MSDLAKHGGKRRRREITRRAVRPTRGNAPEEYFSIRHPDYRKAESRFGPLKYGYYPHQPDYDALDWLEERLRDDREAQWLSSRRWFSQARQIA